MLLNPAHQAFPREATREHQGAEGLLVRELFALQMMTALVTAEVNLTDPELADRAVRLADALVARLNKV